MDSIGQDGRKEHDSDQYEADLQHALDEHFQDCSNLANEATGNNGHVDSNDIETIWPTTLTVMMYIANQLSEAGGRKITEPQLQTLCIQAETWGVTLSPHPISNETEQKPIHPAVAQYENKLQSVIEKHHQSMLLD